MSDHHRYVLPVPSPSEREVTAAQLWAAGAAGLWERPGEVVAWFDAPTTDVPAGGRWELEPDRDWQAAWKATIGTVRAGRFAIVPTWRLADHVPAPDETTLVLDPGRAFGSGHHATTTLCLDALDPLPLEHSTVLDVGCGSGVLAIAAAARGARAVGCDVDPEALAVTADNARRNGVVVETVRGSVTEARTHLAAPADVVVANLVTDTVVALAPVLVEACAPAGLLVVSGVTRERRADVVAALAAAAATTTAVTERDGWVAIRARPDAGP